MKNHLVTLALLFGAFPAASHADDADKKRIQELEEKMAALEKERASLTGGGNTATEAAKSGLFDSSGKVNPVISNSVLIIEGDKSVGTGFVASTEGKKYVYTAAHVLSGNSKLVIRNASGTSFKKFGDLQAAEGADLVRLEILEEVKDSLALYPPDALQINTGIAALGNGGGNGVVSVEKGKILGTSGDSLEVDAGIIQGNSGGPVLEVSSGKVVGLATHLTNARQDVWSEGTRQGNVRRFACRLNKDWKWKQMKIGAFLADAKSLGDYDDLTRLCFAMVQLTPLESGMRLDGQADGSKAALDILQENKDNELVKSLVKMNTELTSRKTSMSDSDLKKKFRSLLSQAQSQATRSNDAFKPREFAWFHRSQAEFSVKARQECLEALRQNIDALK